MQNKLHFYRLRLTVPEHYHSRRTRYLRPQGMSLSSHAFLAVCVVLVFMIVGV